MRINALGNTANDFASDDYIALDGTTNGSRKMKNDILLKETAQNALADNLAPAFDPTRTISNPYKAGESVTYNGKTYTFKFDHYGAWSNSHVVAGIDFFTVYQNALHDNNLTNPADLNDIVENTAILLSVSANTQTLNIPTDYGTGIGVLISIKGIYGDPRYLLQQIIIKQDGNMWSRTYNSYGSGSWTDWNNLKTEELKIAQKMIFAGWSSNLADLNDAPLNTLISVNVTSATTTLNIPSDYSGVGLLFTMRAQNSVGYTTTQVLVRVTDGRVWNRNRSQVGGTLYNWEKWSFPTGMKVAKNAIWTTWASNLADLNEAEENSVILISTSSGTPTLNIPPEFKTGATYNSGELTTYKCNYSNSDYIVYQRLNRWRDNKVWTRQKTGSSGTWGSWSLNGGDQHLFEVGTGKDYTTLRAAITAAYNIGNAKVIIYPGTYNLVEEYADVLATTLTAVSTPCPLGNGIHIIALAGVHIKANIERTEGMTDAHYASLRTYFEPFGFRGGSFTLENLEIESSNCRYCVHDDQGTGPYLHKYINCRMIHKNDAGNVGNNYVSCIGGGLQKNGAISIEGGWYKVITDYGITQINEGDPDYAQQPIAYHNAFQADAEGVIEMHDVFFADKGYLHLGKFGPTTKITKVYVSGCRFGLPILLRDIENDANDNMEVAAEWNNQVSIEGSWVINGQDADFVPST